MLGSRRSVLALDLSWRRGGVGFSNSNTPNRHVVAVTLCWYHRRSRSRHHNSLMYLGLCHCCRPSCQSSSGKECRRRSRSWCCASRCSFSRASHPHHGSMLSAICAGCRELLKVYPKYMYDRSGNVRVVEPPQRDIGTGARFGPMRQMNERLP